MTDTELRHLLVTRGLGRIADALMRLVRPSVAISWTRRQARRIPVGTSRIGDRPDLPAGTAWPTWDGRPMPFLGQFNLTEVAPFDREQLLPDRGLLLFFLGSAFPENSEDGEQRTLSPDERRQAWRVLYAPDDPATFRRTRKPRGLPVLGDEGLPHSCAGRFALAWTLPDAWGPEVWSLSPTEDERGALVELEGLVNRGLDSAGRTPPELRHRLLGYSAILAEPTLVACEEKAQGPQAGRVPADPLSEDRIRAEADINRRWTLLLQLDSDETTGFDWDGGGLLHYCIERNALRARDFSRVMVNEQFL
jgi:uncharacterized protein YwqG